MLHPHEQKAAVAIIALKQHNDYSILILKRTTHPLDPWSGHYAFPGGCQEQCDTSILQTCIRETKEECGIVLDAAMCMYPFPEAVAGKDTDHEVTVTPFLFLFDEKPRVTLNPIEAISYEWLSAAFFFDKHNHTTKALSPVLPNRFFPCIKLDMGYLWGFTYEQLLIAANLLLNPNPDTL